MFRHDFHSISECGHKRNFTYYHGKKKQLKYVHEICHICEKKVKFSVIRYFKEVSEL